MSPSAKSKRPFAGSLRTSRLRESIARRPAAWTSALVVVVAFLLYGGALGADFTHWDDDVYITRNPLVQEFSPAAVGRIFTTFSNCNYHPLTYLTWSTEFSLVGASPWLYHLDNVLLHIGASVLVFFLTRKLFASDGAAFLTTLLFLVHPLKVESVAWIAERNDVLCAVLFLAGLLAYLHFLDRDGGRRGTYALSLAFCLSALLSKVMAVTFPAVQVLFLIYRRRLTRREFALLLPFWALSVLFAVVGILAQRSCGGVKDVHGGDLAAHILTVPKALAIYLEKLAVPYPLSPRYIVDPAASLFEPYVLIGLVLIAAGAVAVWMSWHRNRVALLAIGFFSVTWAPVSGLIPTSTVVADRYMYLPSLGLVWAITYVVAAGFRDTRTDGAPRRKLLARCSLVALLIFAGTSSVLTHRRVYAWHDGITLWKDALTENPENPYAHNQLAVEYLAVGDYEEASRATIRSIQLGFRQPGYLFNLCLAYRGLGQDEKELQTAQGITAGAPDFLPAWSVVLRHLRKKKEFDACERLLDKLTTEFGDDPELRVARGDLNLDRGEYEEALRDYRVALEARPSHRELVLGASLALARLGDSARAMDLARRAVRVAGSVPSPGALERLDELRGLLGEEEAAGLRGGSPGL